MKSCLGENIIRDKLEFYGVNYEKDIIYNMAVYVGNFANTFGIDYVYVTF